MTDTVGCDKLVLNFNRRITLLRLILLMWHSGTDVFNENPCRDY